MSRFACVIAILLLVGLPASAAAQLQLPQPVGYVNDFAHVIPQAQADSIQRIIDEVRAKSGGEIVVVTIPSLQGDPVDDVALRIGREWKIGKSGGPTDSSRATGAVVLVVPKETSDDGRGHLKIETGIGTTQFITAAEAGRIADRYMVPFFRDKNYGSGILHGVAAIAQQYAQFFHFQLTGAVPPQPQASPGGGGGFGRLVFWGIVIVVILAMIFGGRGGGGGRGGRRRRRSMFPIFLPFPIGGGHRGGWGGFGGGFGGFGGGGGGGFGGFGGSGGFGGGGAGRSW